MAVKYNMLYICMSMIPLFGAFQFPEGYLDLLKKATASCSYWQESPYAAAAMSVNEQYRELQNSQCQAILSAMKTLMKKHNPVLYTAAQEVSAAADADLKTWSGKVRTAKVIAGMAPVTDLLAFDVATRVRKVLQAAL